MHFGIIAAGEGSRLAGEGISVPKPLLPVGGVPLIERLILIFRRAGAGSVNVVVNEYMTDVREFLEGLRESLDVALNVRVKTTPSSMHTFYELSEMIPRGERFVATTVDTVFREESFLEYVAAWRGSAPETAGMMAVTDFIEDEKPLYVKFAPESGRIEAFLDTPQDGEVYVSGGVYGLDGRAVDVLEDCMERGVERMRNYQRALLEAGLRLQAWPMGKIIDVDHAGDIVRAEEFLKSKT